MNQIATRSQARKHNTTKQLDKTFVLYTSSKTTKQPELMKLVSLESVLTEENIEV